MNLKQMRSIVKRNTGADTMNMPDYSIDLFINLSQQEIVRQTLCLRKTAAITTIGGSIVTITDYSGTVAGTVLIKTGGSALATGDIVTLLGTTSYNGTYSITVVSSTTFYVTATYVASETSGTYHKSQHDLPADFHKSTEMKIGSNFPQFKTEEYIQRLYTTTPATGTPYYYYIDREADNYGLYPVPSGAETGIFMYRALPATLSSDTDTPDIPAPYHDLIVAGASYRVAEQMNNVDLFNQYFSLFNVLMNTMANDMASRQADIEPQIVQSQDILDA